MPSAEKTKKSIDFMSHRVKAFFLSGFLTLAVIIALALHGLNLGIDFTGGVVVEMRGRAEVSEIRQIIAAVGYKNAIVQSVDDGNGFMLRFYPHIDQDQSDLAENLRKVFDNMEILKVEYVGPKVGSEMVRNGISAMFFAIIAMMGYIYMRFNLRYAIGVVVALMHDLIVTLGFYVVTRFEFDLTSIAALLTILGYSINDSVVIYDRIRENVKKYSTRSLIEIINTSLNETLSRTIMTVLTTLVACLALVLWGGEVLRGFSSAVLFGIAFGTYSSIFISAPILVYIKQAKLATN